MCIFRKKLFEIVRDMCKPSKINVTIRIVNYLGQQRFAIVADKVHSMMCLRWIMLATLPNFLRSTIINNWYIRIGYESKTSEGLFCLRCRCGWDIGDPMTSLYNLIRLKFNNYNDIHFEYTLSKFTNLSVYRYVSLDTIFETISRLNISYPNING